MVVVLQTVGLATAWVVGNIAPDTERRDTKLDLRVDAHDGVVDLLDGHIDIVATPITYIVKTTWISRKSLCIRKILTCHRIRIEIVVHVDGLDIVAGNEVSYHLAEEITCLLEMRSEVPLCTILEEPLWMLVVDVVVGDVLNLAAATCHTIRVDPNVYVNTAFVSLSTYELQRIVGSRLALFASQPMTPWLKLGLVQSISRRTNLKDDGIEIHVLESIQHGNHVGFLLLIVADSRFSREIDVGYSTYPCSAKIRLCSAAKRYGHHE